MFSKVELWLVLLLLLIEFVGAVLFAGLVLRAERQTTPLGPVGSAALALAELPGATRDLLLYPDPLRAANQKIFDGKPTGWSFPSGPMTGPQGYLLLSRVDGDGGGNIIELLSMPEMSVQYRWNADHSAMLEMIGHHSPFSDAGSLGAAYFRDIHPWLLDDGDLIVKDHFSPAFRVDPCGDPVWVIDSHTFHHSTEADAEGNLWIASVAEEHSLPRLRHSFLEDELVKISPEGKVLYSQSVVQILMRNGYANWLFASDMYNDDPTHLNDIEPVLEDGPYWKKGDVFVSLRNVSAIMLFRPATGELVWLKRGPWMSQHDVDILDDHRISVYDNRAQDLGTSGPHVPESSRILVYDFATNEVTSRLDEFMSANEMTTEAAGLYTALPDGSAVIEDATDARLLIARPDGSVAAEFVNRDEHGEVAMLGWSRFIGKDRGDALLERLRQVQCHG